MAGEITLPVIGNLTADPELRFTPSGSAVANFTIAVTPKVFDRQTNQSKDGTTTFLRASVWGEMAENVAETLTKGMRVIAFGQLAQRDYETKEGEKRSVMEFKADAIGPDLRWATAKVARSQRGQGGGQQGGGGGQWGASQGGGGWSSGQSGTGGGWGSQQGSQGSGWGTGGGETEPPF